MAIRYKKKKITQSTSLFQSVSFNRDLCVINDHLEFDKNHEDIYSSELIPKKQNVSSSEASCLNFSIVIENKYFKINLFDKRDTFPLCYISYATFGQYHYIK